MIDPYWTYFVDIYTGQHDVKVTTTGHVVNPSGTTFTAGSTNQASLSRQNRRSPISGTFVNGTSISRGNSYAFSSSPRMILSLQGVNQGPPPDGDTDYGFSC